MLNTMQKAIIARVEPDIKAAFKRRAKQRRITESELLRVLVLAEIDQHKDVSEHVEPEPEKSGLLPITVRLAAFIRDAAMERARVSGMTMSRWIAALVQSNVTRHPVLTQEAVLAVQASNRELAAIGRNINQIARSLNEAFYETERVRIDLLAELAEVIARDRQAIRDLVRASNQAWGGDSE